MTEKQKRFADEYLIDLNATQSAIRAGYSKKTAYSIGEENLSKPEIRQYIDEKLNKLSSDTIAEAKEVMQYLTAVLRGEEYEETVVVEGCGDGHSKAAKVKKEVGAKERLKAAELLGKRYSLFTDRVKIDGAMAVQIIDDIPEGDNSG